MKPLFVLRVPLAMILVIGFGCQSPPKPLSEYSTVQARFSADQIQDLESIHEFFVEQACHDLDPEVCFGAELLSAYTIDYDMQVALYDSLHSGVHYLFWIIGWQNVEGDSLAYQFYSPDGAYKDFLQDVAMEYPVCSPYVSTLLQFGDVSTALDLKLKSILDSGPVQDARIQLIVALHYLSLSDQANRREFL